MSVEMQANGVSNSSGSNGNGGGALTPLQLAGLGKGMAAAAAGGAASSPTAASTSKGAVTQRSPSPTLSPASPLPMPAGMTSSGGGRFSQSSSSSSSLASLSGHNVLSYWVTHRLLSPDRVERHYAYLLSGLVGASLLFGLMKSEGPLLLWGSPICSLWSTALVAVTLGNVWAEQRHFWRLFEATRGVQFLLCMLSVLIYYEGSNVVNRYRYAALGPAMLWDPVLLRMDNALWGWLWPQGQMALWLDTQTLFGVTTFLGRCYAEVFQILYVSYYFWGNAIGVVLTAKYFYFSVWKKNKGTRKRLQWRCIQMFVTAWVGAFVFNHLINLCFPAVSPRIYLATEYQNELRGLWVLASMRNAITAAAANTFSAFPSGHCGLSILAVLLAYRIHGLTHWYTRAVMVSTVLIVLATQVLRYHYFVDFLFSLVVVGFGAWFGGFHDLSVYNHSLSARGLEDVDEEGKMIHLHLPGEEEVHLSSIGLASPDGGSSGGAFDRAAGENELVPLSSSSAAKSSNTTAAGRGGLDEEEEEEEEEQQRNGSNRNNPPLVLSANVFGNNNNKSADNKV